MLQARNVPLQDVNDVLDRAKQGKDRYSQGVLDTLLWLNGDAGMPFGQEPKRYTQADREQLQIPGTLTTAGVADEPADEGEDAPEE